MPVAEQRIEALGKTWRFTFGFFALCTLEEQFDQPFVFCLLRYFPTLKAEDLAGDAAEEKVEQARFGARMTDLRALMIAALSEHQPDITMRKAGAIVDEVGVATIGTMLKRCILASLGGSEGTENPPT